MRRVHLALVARKDPQTPHGFLLEEAATPFARTASSDCSSPSSPHPEPLEQPLWLPASDTRPVELQCRLPSVRAPKCQMFFGQQWSDSPRPLTATRMSRLTSLMSSPSSSCDPPSRPVCPALRKPSACGLASLPLY